MDKPRVPGKKKERKTNLNQQVEIETSAISLPALCPEGSTGGLFDVFVTATPLHWTILGCDVLFLS